MGNWKELLIILAVIVGVVAAVWWLLPYLIRRGVDVGGVLTAAGTGVDTADKIVDTLQEMLPANPYLAVADKIINWCQQGVEAAEQLYKSQQIPAEQRKDEAIAYVYSMLKFVGMEITPEIEKIVEGGIQAGVFFLPPTHANETLTE